MRDRPMRTQGGRVDDQFDVPLEDADLLAEVELTTNLMIAASQSDAHLSQDEVDRLLGVDGRNVADVLGGLDRGAPGRRAAGGQAS